MRSIKSMFLALLVLLSTDASALYKCTGKWMVSYQSSPCEPQLRQERFSKEKLGKAQIYDGLKFEKGFELKDISVEKESTVTNGEQWITYEVTAINNTSFDKRIALTYHGIDSEGSVVKEIFAVGVVHAHSSKSFKDHATVPVSDLNRIQKWVLAR